MFDPILRPFGPTPRGLFRAQDTSCLRRCKSPTGGDRPHRKANASSTLDLRDQPPWNRSANCIKHSFGMRGVARCLRSPATSMPSVTTDRIVQPGASAIFALVEPGVGGPHRLSSTCPGQKAVVLRRLLIESDLGLAPLLSVSPCRNGAVFF